MTGTTKSLSMSVPAALRDDCNRLMRALGRDDAPDPGRTFTVELSPAGNPTDVVTRYGAHTYDDDLADILDNGVVPGNIDWARFGLTAARAQAAFAAISYRAVPGRASVVNFVAEITARGVKRITREELL